MNEGTMYAHRHTSTSTHKNQDRKVKTKHLRSTEKSTYGNQASQGRIGRIDTSCTGRKGAKDGYPDQEQVKNQQINKWKYKKKEKEENAYYEGHDQTVVTTTPDYYYSRQDRSNA